MSERAFLIEFSDGATIILVQVICSTKFFGRLIIMKELFKALGQAALGDKFEDLKRLKAVRDEYRTFSDQKLIDICRHDAGIKRRVAVFVLKERRRT